LTYYDYQRKVVPTYPLASDSLELISVTSATKKTNTKTDGVDLTLKSHGLRPFHIHTTFLSSQPDDRDIF
jgi:hypothetical protein